MWYVFAGAFVIMSTLFEYMHAGDHVVQNYLTVSSTEILPTYDRSVNRAFAIFLASGMLMGWTAGIVGGVYLVPPAHIEDISGASTFIGVQFAGGVGGMASGVASWCLWKVGYLWSKKICSSESQPLV